MMVVSERAGQNGVKEGQINRIFGLSAILWSPDENKILKISTI